MAKEKIAICTYIHSHNLRNDLPAIIEIVLFRFVSFRFVSFY